MDSCNPCEKESTRGDPHIHDVFSLTVVSNLQSKDMLQKQRILVLLREEDKDWNVKLLMWLGLESMVSEKSQPIY